MLAALQCPPDPADPADVNKLLETTAHTKVAQYREAYANRPGTTYALLILILFGT